MCVPEKVVLHVLLLHLKCRVKQHHLWQNTIHGAFETAVREDQRQRSMHFVGSPYWQLLVYLTTSARTAFREHAVVIFLRAISNASRRVLYQALLATEYWRGNDNPGLSKKCVRNSRHCIGLIFMVATVVQEML